VHSQHWPEIESNLLIDDSVSIPVQINGKVRGKIQISPRASEGEVVEILKQQEFFVKVFACKEPKRIVYVPGKIVNIVQ